jgi:uncharacterized protein (TIGR00730 family)
MPTTPKPLCPPRQRRRPLPVAAPKPTEEDPGALERVRAIMASPTYRRADQDVDFLARDELRPPRLELEYLKPELGLQAAGVHSTIVVFGGTRLLEPAAAARNLERARAAAAAAPQDPETRRELHTATRLQDLSRYYGVARDFGRIVGGSGDGPLDCRLTIVTGGGPGAMEAANRGAFDVGAKSIGLNITLPHEQFPNPYVTPGLCFQFRYFALRKMHFLVRARALVALPGGYGTLDELFEVLTLIQTRTIHPLPVVLIGEAFWRRVFDAEFLVAEGLIDPEDAEIFCYAESGREAWERICAWYEQAGEPLLPICDVGAPDGSGSVL